MSYSYRDDLTSADAAFDVRAASREELLRESVDAMLQLMIDELSSLRPDARREATLVANDLEALLYETLERVLFFKDAEGLLLRLTQIRIVDADSALTAHLTFEGAHVRTEGLALGTDVKAVTWHHFKARRESDAWHATVVVDI